MYGLSELDLRGGKSLENEPESPATTPPDFTEQARQLECLMADCKNPPEHFCLRHVLETHCLKPDREAASKLVCDWRDEWKIPTPDDPDQVDCQSDLINRVASFAAEAATRGQAVGIERAAQVTGKRIHAYLSELHQVLETPPAPPEGEDNFSKEIRSLSPDPDYLDRVRTEAATAEREQITRIVENMRERGEPDKQKQRLMISVVEVLAAIGDDKE